MALLKIDLKDYVVHEDIRHSDDITKMCKCCLIQSTSNIFEAKFQHLFLSEMLEKCASIRVEKADNQPQNMCFKCIGQLIQAYLFQCKLIKSQEVLKEKVQLPEQNLLNTIKIIEDDDDTTATDPETDLPLLPCYVTNTTKFNEQIPVKPCPINEIIDNNKETPENVDPTPCSYCKELFPDRVSVGCLLKEHNRIAKHPIPKNFVCNVCTKVFTKSATLRYHQRSHIKEQPFKCDVCSKRFTLARTLTRHKLMHAPMHTCDICQRGFLQLSTFQDHKRIVHAGETPFQCTKCGLCFKRPCHLSIHARKHYPLKRPTTTTTAKPAAKTTTNIIYKCSLCPKQFNTCQKLKQHQLCHGDKPFLCTICGFSSNRNVTLQAHMRTHTKERPYACEYCEKRFAQVSSLIAHRLTHSGVRAHSCHLCQRSFVHVQHLRRHMRTHTGEKPYLCSFCGRAFAQKANLTVHARIHTGECPFVCDVCNRGFYSSSCLKKHRRTHDRKNNMS